jgi:hypothetical protein
MKDEAKAKFAESLRGPVIGPGHPDYEEARKLYNAMIDKRPRLVARCADVGDVIAAVNFGRDSGMPIAIRGGAHNGPGFGSVNDGLVIDLSAMKGVRVDPMERTARAGAGCTQGDLDHATHAFGLATPAGIISTTGIAGLTLSGGHGYLSRKYGLTISIPVLRRSRLADNGRAIYGPAADRTSVEAGLFRWWFSCRSSFPLLFDCYATKIRCSGQKFSCSAK